ncbi:hypothetical protein EVAR_13032_1 [Eumeta japonica]|uniref:Uncharacterized protein n=1 Tax=Eumeta variegata TaxID=151549 RepID=A0A4C1VH60_EUMVA|nr:hypothetical protein EVAR_13032_1 [Eumeta japonica]
MPIVNKETRGKFEIIRKFIVEYGVLSVWRNVGGKVEEGRKKERNFTRVAGGLKREKEYKYLIGRVLGEGEKEVGFYMNFKSACGAGTVAGDFGRRLFSPPPMELAYVIISLYCVVIALVTAANSLDIPVLTQAMSACGLLP